MQLNTEILSTFQKLFKEATQAGEPEPNAMTLATADLTGRVSARTVLLKHVDESGFVFYTNTRSLKGQQISSNAQVALLFLWKNLDNQVQVRVEGHVTMVTPAEADAYFATRPRESQIGAWASLQSERLEDQHIFEQRIMALTQQFSDQPVPRPPHWTGYLVQAQQVEFWYGASFRLHERVLYTSNSDNQWDKCFLYP